MRENPSLIDSSGGALHLMAQRNDVAAVKWLLARGADVNGRWASGGADVTPLHLAASRGHTEMVRLLLGAGADPRIRDSLHDGDAIGWAEHFQQPAIVEVLKDHPSSA
jgi:ankyrin repeat protein